jgi:hypothetical protein
MNTHPAFRCRTCHADLTADWRELLVHLPPDTPSPQGIHHLPGAAGEPTHAFLMTGNDAGSRVLAQLKAEVGWLVREHGSGQVYVSMWVKGECARTAYLIDVDAALRYLNDAN